ncbi:MAG TPA: hypothetical protein DEG26_07930 [Chloroflexi bacterium]|nr:hypothetical protein [Chloroflexota bacterium]
MVGLNMLRLSSRSGAPCGVGGAQGTGAGVGVGTGVGVGVISVPWPTRVQLPSKVQVSPR